MNYLIVVVLILVSEIVLAFMFSVISQVFYRKLGFDFRSILKGVVERMFLMFCLFNDYPHALTFFSALKLGTRLKHEEKPEVENKYNDFYLIGNLISVMVAIGYVLLLKYFIQNNLL